MPEHMLGLVVVGLCGGLLGSCFGVGGGAIMVPALVYLAFPQKESQALSLASMVPMALVGALRYRWTGQAHLDPAVIAVIATAAVAGVLIGTQFVGQVSDEVLRKGFAIFLLAVSLKMLLGR